MRLLERRSRWTELEEEIAAATDPREDEEWFQAMPAETRQAWTEEWKQGLRRKVALHRAERRELWIDAVRIAALLLVGDLCTTLSTPASVAGSILVGLATGALVAWRDWARLLSLLVIVPTWRLVESWAHDGLYVMHFVVGFPLACAVAYAGVRREERVFD